MQTEERGKRKQEEKKRKRKICTATLTNDNTVKNEARTLSEMWVLWDCVQFQVNYKYTYYNQHCSSSVHHLGLVVAKHYALEFSIKRYLKREERSSLLFETAFAFNAFKSALFGCFCMSEREGEKVWCITHSWNSLLHASRSHIGSDQVLRSGHGHTP